MNCLLTKSFSVDGYLPQMFLQLTEVSTFMIARLIAVTLVAPATLLPSILFAVSFALCGRLYLKAQLSVKREMSNSQAPIVSHFGAAMTGLSKNILRNTLYLHFSADVSILVSIRAYGAQEPVKLESLTRIDRYTKASRTFRDINRCVFKSPDSSGFGCMLTLSKDGSRSG